MVVEGKGVAHGQGKLRDLQSTCVGDESARGNW